MESKLEKWQRSQIRTALDRYSEMQEEHYFIRNKRKVEVWDGLKAYSLLSPPLRSHAATRRVRYIAQNIIDSGTVVREDGSATWGKRTPHFLTVAVTYACQCDCVHCSAYTYREKVAAAGDGLTVAEYKDAIAQAIELGTTCVILTGGEPLLYPGIYDIIPSVDRAKAVVTIFTNGELLTPDVARRLKDAGLFGVFVSLDAPNAAEHDANRRRPGLFATACDTIRRVQDAGLLSGISTFATHERLKNGQLDAMMDLAKQLGVLEVFLFDLIATGRLVGEHECMLSQEEVTALQAFQTRYNESPDYPRVIHQTMFTSIAYPCAAAGCPAGVAQMHLRANGDVSPCDFTPFSFGNVRRQPLADIWRSITTSPTYAAGSPGCRLRDAAYWDKLATETQPA